MDNNYNSNDYYQNTGADESVNKYRLNQSSSDINLNGEQSTPQQNTYNTNPYGVHTADRTHTAVTADSTATSSLQQDLLCLQQAFPMHR